MGPFTMRRRISHHSSGMALVLVLAAIVLLSVLILAVLASAKTERTAAGSQINQTETRLLSENVLSLVTAQIREATTGTNAWISQPGAIRTFTGAKQPDRVYKLYSAQEMVVSGSAFNPASLADVPTGGGELNGNLFTDLNAPVKVNSTWVYPILDPAALDVVEGFTETSGSSGVAKTTIQGNPAQIPMPVRWLYVLKDGQLQAMDDTGKVTLASATNPIVGRIAFWADDETCKLNINTASSGMYWDQPIGKGNQFERGTFAAGAANSLPVVTRTGLASSPPAVREFQRYPGHPAMTSLDVVFNNTAFFSSSLTAEDRSKKILELAPRTNWGGSELGTKFPVTTAKGGTVTLDKDRLYATVDELFYKQPGIDDTSRTGMATSGTGTPATPATPAMSLTPVNLSLARFFLTANSRAPEVTAFNTPRVTIWPVDSKATDRTVFDKTIAFCSKVGGREYIFQRSAFDPMKIGLVDNSSFTGASNTGSQSATLDFTANNSTLYSYLKELMAKPYPGFGDSLASKFGTDSDQILTEIYDYIRSSNLFDCSDANAKPYTGRFFYWNEANRLVGAGNTSGCLKSLPLPRDPAVWNLPLAYYVASAYGGQVVPAVIGAPAASGTTRGFGRFPTIVGATLGFFATDTNPGKTPADFAKMTYQPFPSPHSLSRSQLASWTANNSQPAGQIRGVLLFSVANPSAGPLTITHTYDIRVNSGLSSFKVNGASANMTDGAINRVLGLPHRSVEGSGLALWDNLLFGGGNVNPSTRTYNAVQRGGITPTGANSNSYPFFSQSNIPVSGNTLNFTGGTLDIDILVDNQVVQNVKMEFPNFTAPMPLWAPVTLTPASPFRLIDCRQVAVSGTTATVTTRWDNRVALGAGGENSPMRYTLPSPANLGINLAMCLMPNNLDTVRGIELNASAVPYGDARLVAGLQNVPASYFQKCAGYDNSARNQAHSLWGHPQATNGSLVAGVSAASGSAAQILFGLPSTMTAATRSDGTPGDWDAGVARVDVFGAGFPEAGAFINKPSDGAASFRDGSGRPSLPYFQVSAMIASLDNAFTPNRMMPSPGMFGSLPVGVKRGMPWQTLLFRPNSPAHPGAVNPPDHLILDLFQMPVVEPYAISEPFSTAGKVNLNWQIAPFSYIKRSTALRGVLYPEKITAVPTSNAFLITLNPDGTNSSDATFNYRYNIDRDATMKLFEKRFTDNTPFLTASQICEMPLVPKPENVNAKGLVPASKNPFQTALSANATASQVQTYVDGFWANTSLGGAGTADNLRERPYTTIYPRVTTKSNTYTVHLRVQKLKKRRGADPQTFDQTKDTVTSGYRGSFIIERFLDPKASAFDITDSTSTLGPYKFRVINTKQFNP